jgi:hypothetical protein
MVTGYTGFDGREVGQATLSGISFLSHQITSFFSAWLGGESLSAMVSYTIPPFPALSLLLSAPATFVRFRLKET